MKDRIIIKGLTWDRAYAGLDAEPEAPTSRRIGANSNGIAILFVNSERPIAETAAKYDLVILDHPFMVDAAASGCLVDLNRYARELDLQQPSATCVGPSFASYVYEKALWALPMDAACQNGSDTPWPAPCS